LLVSKDNDKIQPFAAEIGARVVDPSQAAELAEMIMLGCKPKDLWNVASKIEKSMPDGKIVVSMLAGIDTHSLQKAFPSCPHHGAGLEEPVRVLCYGTG
jgi:pyrroline-5-carboxylate reductase